MLGLRWRGVSVPTHSSNPCCAVLCCGVVSVPAQQVGVAARRESLGETLAGLQEMLMYGLKGMAAYTHHAGMDGVCVGQGGKERVLCGAGGGEGVTQGMAAYTYGYGRGWCGAVWLAAE